MKTIPTNVFQQLEEIQQMTMSEWVKKEQDVAFVIVSLIQG